MRALRNRDFRRLWISGGISGLGSWLLVVAIPFYVFDLTGSPVATGLALALEALPALLVGPWAGVLLDRWNLTRALWIAELVSAAAVALILFAEPDRIWPIYVAILAESTASTVFRPAARALLPSVVGTGNELAGANALNAFTGSTIRLAVPPLGALLLAGPGIEFVLAVDILSYLLSAAIIRTVRTQRHPTTEQVDNPLAGFQHVVRHRVLRGILLGQTIFLTANAGLTALLVPFTVERLHAPGYVLGYLISGLGAGYLIGAALSTKALTWLGIRDLIAVTQLAAAAAFFALFNAPNITTAIAAAALIGIPGSILLITAETAIQRTAPTNMLGRIGALFFAADSLALLVGALVAPAMTVLLDLPLTLNLLAAFAVLAAPLTLAAVPRHPAHFTRTRSRT
ncbi:putative MFS family arabinose efflux permease [Kribbella antiqua]|uniref:Putative MFS family arabinose efflux permease n=1 Tax=Kribbella antiqua TaxID=2512217 RepID=A0A4R2IQT5_9ACTN|nr:MFS transporter [Kribbella antiqua]TCO47731.1 putative MFS family arabinose efflux permease [Kribbella antiqua]